MLRRSVLALTRSLVAMASRADVVEARRARLQRIAEAAAASAVATWRQADVRTLDDSWETLSPQIERSAVTAQVAAVAGSSRFVGRLAALDGVRDATPLEPAGLVGVDGSGRSLRGLLHGAVTTTKEQIGAGVGTFRAFESGAAYLAAMLQTAVMDVARQGDMAAGVARKYDYYVRVVQPGACSRCLVLAGAIGMSDFQRHPACKCSVQPMTREAYAEFNPFAGQSDDDLRRSLGRDGFEAYEAGGDIGQIVSARRGALVDSTRPANGPVPRRAVLRQETVGVGRDGQPIRVFTTYEGVSVRGSFGRNEVNLYATGTERTGRYRQVTRRRLMPESIFQIASDPSEARVLLIDAGYISPSRAFPGFPGPAFQAEAQANRAAADAIFRRAGIQIDRR